VAQVIGACLAKRRSRVQNLGTTKKEGEENSPILCYVTFKSLKYQHKQLKGMIYLFWLAASKGSVHGFLAPCTRAYHHGSKNEWGSREK
jgi:hypothetical protein